MEKQEPKRIEKQALRKAIDSSRKKWTMIRLSSREIDTAEWDDFSFFWDSTIMSRCGFCIESKNHIEELGLDEHDFDKCDFCPLVDEFKDKCYHADKWIEFKKIMTINCGMNDSGSHSVDGYKKAVVEMCDWMLGVFDKIEREKLQ